MCEPTSAAHTYNKYKYKYNKQKSPDEECFFPAEIILIKNISYEIKIKYVGSIRTEFKCQKKKEKCQVLLPKTVQKIRKWHVCVCCAPHMHVTTPNVKPTCTGVDWILVASPAVLCSIQEMNCCVCSERVEM